MLTRISGFVIADTTFETLSRNEADPARHAEVLWQILDLCAATEQRACIHLAVSANENIPVALVELDVSFPDDDTSHSVPIFSPLTTRYPALARSLQVLEIAGNKYDESAALGAFAALATKLTELSLWDCGLSSVRDFEGRCEYLRTVYLGGCERLVSLDGLGHHAYLEEITASRTPIIDIEPLRTCPALTTVDIFACERLSSVEALEGHVRLKEVDVSWTPISSLEPLRTCPALTKVDITGCDQLPTNIEFPASVRVVTE